MVLYFGHKLLAKKLKQLSNHQTKLVFTQQRWVVSNRQRELHDFRGARWNSTQHSLRRWLKNMTWKMTCGNMKWWHGTLIVGVFWGPSGLVLGDRRHLPKDDMWHDNISMMLSRHGRGSMTRLKIWCGGTWGWYMAGGNGTFGYPSEHLESDTWHVTWRDSRKKCYMEFSDWSTIEWLYRPWGIKIHAKDWFVKGFSVYLIFG